MPRPKSLKPKLCLHKPSGRAFVRLDGVKATYLGQYGTQAAQDAYDRVIGEWIAHGRQHSPQANAQPGTTPTGYSISQMILAFWRHAEGYYKPDEDGHSEADNFKLALRPLRRLYGDTPAADFGPMKLKAIRDAMLKPRTVQRPRKVKDPATGETVVKPTDVVIPGWSRRYANRQVSRLRQVFKWAVEHELIPAAVYHALVTVSGLKKGHTDAREIPDVEPAQDKAVDAVLKFVSPQIKAMIELEGITGMRPNEVRRMRGCDIDTRKDVWVYNPYRHKNLNHDQPRPIMLGPRCQQILRPFLKMGEVFLFSPRDAEAWRRERQRAARKTPLTPSQIKRGELAAGRERKRPIKDRYDKDSFNRAIRRACAKAKLAKHFTPNQLRHAAACRFRETYDLDTAQALLGHRLITTTQVYAKKTISKAHDVMALVG